MNRAANQLRWLIPSVLRTGTVFVWGEGGSLPAGVTANIRPNPALKRDVRQATRPLALLQGLHQIFTRRRVFIS